MIDVRPDLRLTADQIKAAARSMSAELSGAPSRLVLTDMGNRRLLVTDYPKRRWRTLLSQSISQSAMLLRLSQPGPCGK